MPTRQSLLQTRVDAATAARVRLHAERAGQSVSEWIAHLLRREVLRSGAADALAGATYEAAMTVGYMLRTLLIDTLGTDAAERAIEAASETAAAADAATTLTNGAGVWQGRAALRLGLAGEVAPADFAAVLAGRSPRDDLQLVAPETTSGKHRGIQSVVIGLPLWIGLSAW